MNKYIKIKDGSLREYKKGDIKKAAILQNKYLYFNTEAEIKNFIKNNYNFFSMVSYSASSEPYTAEDGTNIFTLIF